MASAPSVRHDRPFSPHQLRRAGSGPAPQDGPGACVFAARCPFAADVCATQPPLTAIGERWSVACHRHEEWGALARVRKPVKPVRKDRPMPVEFIGMISTRDQSEIRRSRGPVVDRDYVRRFARAHEDAGFDRVLIGYSSSQPDGTQVAAYAAAHTDRLSFLVAHRPGFVAPTLAARTFATLDQFAGGRIAVHIITGGSDGEQRRDGDHLSKDERYDRTDEYLDVLKQAWTSDAPFDYHGRYYQVEDFYADVRSPQQPRIPLYFGGSSEAAYRVGGKHADVYALWGEPLAETAEQIASVRAAAAAAGRTRPPRISVSFRPILGPTEELAWERAHQILATTRANIEEFRGQWRRPDRRPRRRAPAEPGLPAPAGRGGQGRAARPGAVDAAGRRHRRRRELHRAGRDAGDGGPGPARLRGHRGDHPAHPGLRPLRRRHRLRPAPAAAGPRGSQPPGPVPAARGGSRGRRRVRRRTTSMNHRQLKLGAVTMGAGGPGRGGGGGGASGPAGSRTFRVLGG